MSTQPVLAQRNAGLTTPELGGAGRFFSGPVPVMLLTFALLVPFLNKAYTIDDTLFIRVGEQVLKDPLHPYGMDYNWMGRLESFWNATANPPLAGYLIAIIAAIGGMREFPIHLAFAFMAVACAWLMYQIARRICGHPALAVTATVVTPAFVVSACNVMADVPLLFFWLVAVWAAILFVEDGRTGMIWLAALAATAAAMTKYFGIAVVPLLVAYCLAARQGRRWHVAALLLPIAVLALWGQYSKEQIGFFHPILAAKYSVEYKGVLGHGLLRANAHTVSFLGGGMVWPIALLPLLFFGAPNRWAAVLQIVVVALFVGIMTWFEYHTKEIELSLRGPQWLFCLTLTSGAMTVLAGLRGWSAKFDRQGLLMALWLGGTLVFSAFFNWTVNERILVPAIFPAAVLAIRWIESTPSAKFWTAWCGCALIPTVALGVLVAAADAEFAAAGKTFAQTTARELIHEGRRVLFAGHWGFQYYMEQEGAIALDFRNPQVVAGDLVIYPTTHTTTEAPPIGWSHILSDSKDTYANSYGVHTLDGGGGYYSSVFGNVPFVPAENRYVDRFIVLERAGTRQRRR